MSNAYIKCQCTFVHSNENAVLVKPSTPLVGTRWIPNKCLSEESIATAFYADWGQKVELEVQEWKAREARLI